MWFGTDNGLARFDGRRVQNFSPGGSDKNRVITLKTAPSGELWIGTEAGAFIYSENRFKPVGGTSDVGITAILFSGDIFLGTDSGLVLRIRNGADGKPIAEKMFSESIRADNGSPLHRYKSGRDRRKSSCCHLGARCFCHQGQ